MEYWVVKGRPEENDFDAVLVPDTEQSWRTGRPLPKLIAKGDMVFIWASSPLRKLLGIAQFQHSLPDKDEWGNNRFLLKYTSSRLSNPLGIEDLRNDTVLNSDGVPSFLKAGAAGTIFSLTAQQGQRIQRLLAAGNPSLSPPQSDEEARPPTLVNAVMLIAPTLASAHRRVLEALLFAPLQSASARQLQVVLGLAAVVQVNSAMGYVGRKVHEALGAHPDGLALGEYEWWHVIATGTSTKDSGFIWKLREEVTAGLIACGFTVSGDVAPNEVVDAELLLEGAVRQITVNAYERNPVARARCIEVHGAICVVCNFDFGSVYGAMAEGFIHVHHIKSLASIGAQYEVNPIEDLRPVCPNRHAVLHMTNPPGSIEELKAMLAAQTAPNKANQEDKHLKSD